jgi:hypothetical protein
MLVGRSGSLSGPSAALLPGLDQPGVGEVVAELVRVDSGYSGLVAAALHQLLQPGRGETPFRADPQPLEFGEA